jgi:hypothetical protein
MLPASCFFLPKGSSQTRQRWKPARQCTRQCTRGEDEGLLTFHPCLVSKNPSWCSHAYPLRHAVHSRGRAQHPRHPLPCPRPLCPPRLGLPVGAWVGAGALARSRTGIPRAPHTNSGPCFLVCFLQLAQLSQSSYVQFHLRSFSFQSMPLGFWGLLEVACSREVAVPSPRDPRTIVVS